MRKINLLKPSEQSEQIHVLIARFKHAAIGVVIVFMLACGGIMLLNFYALNQNNTLISQAQQYTQTIQREKEIESLYTALSHKVLYAESVITNRFPYAEVTTAIYGSVLQGSIVESLSIDPSVIAVTVSISKYDQLQDLITKMQSIRVLRSYEVVLKEVTRKGAESYRVQFEFTKSK